MGNEEYNGHGPTIMDTGIGRSTEGPTRVESYDSDQVARYIDLYRKMHQASVILNSSLSLYGSSQGRLRSDLKSPIRDFVGSLRKAIEGVRTKVPERIKGKVSFGQTLCELESLATNALLEIDK